jgi:hypothetical protein
MQLRPVNSRAKSPRLRLWPSRTSHKPRAKISRNTQTDRNADHRTGKSGKTAKGSRLENTLSAAKW